MGLDIKTGFADYERVTAVPRSGVPVQESLDLLCNALRERGLGLEIRTTWHPSLHDADTMQALGAHLASQGIKSWVWQSCRVTPEMPSTLSAHWHPPHDQLLRHIEQQGVRVVLR